MDTNTKLKEFQRSSEMLANKEYEEIEKEVEKEIEEGTEQEIREYEEKKKISFEKTEKKLEKEYNKKIYNYEIQCKKEIIEEEKRLKEETIKSAIEILKKYVNTENYFYLLENNIEECLKNIEENKNTKIGLVKKDMDRFLNKVEEKYKVKCYEIEDKYIGGCILENLELGIYIDNTLLNKAKEITF